MFSKLANLGRLILWHLKILIAIVTCGAFLILTGVSLLFVNSSLESLAKNLSAIGRAVMVAGYPSFLIYLVIKRIFPR